MRAKESEKWNLLRAVQLKICHSQFLTPLIALIHCIFFNFFHQVRGSVLLQLSFFFFANSATFSRPQNFQFNELISAYAMEAVLRLDSCHPSQ